MTAQSNFPMNDLVLRLAGGQRDGELIPVKTQKCFLGTEESSNHSNDELAKCAIFRGPNGAAVRSYGNDVSVNGVATTVHWLKEGDRIEFPNSMTVEVAQLGWVESSCEELGDLESEIVEPEAVEFASSDPSEYETSSARFDSEFDCESNGDQSEGDAEPKAVTEGDTPENTADTETPTHTATQLDTEMPVTTETPVKTETQDFSLDDSRLEMIELQIEDMQSQGIQAQQRFDQLESKLSTLTDQISQLVSLANGPVATTEVEEEEFVTFGNANDEDVDEPTPELSSEESFMPQSDADPIADVATGENPDLQSMGDFYSYSDEDDEKIMTFDSELAADEAQATTNANVEVNDAPPELNGINQAEIDSRLSEMEAVFGSGLAEPDEESAQPDEDSAEPTILQSANEQTFDSFNSPTHGLDEESVSFAEHTTTEANPLVESDSLASQLLNDVCSEESPVDSSEVDFAKAEAMVEEQIVEDEPDAETVEESNSVQSNSSVADLLAKMKADGQWDGIPDGDEPSEPTPEPVVAAPVEPIASEESEDDVQDYMSQLLTRMRGDEPATQPEPVAAKPVSAPKAETAETEEVFVAPANPLKPEEFKPSRKAQRIELGAMRELANSSSRHAVHASEKIRRKELGYVQIGIAVCSFLMSIYYLLWNSTQVMDTGFFIGLICIGIAGFLGFRFYITMKYNERMEAIPTPDKKKAAKAEDEATPVTE